MTLTGAVLQLESRHAVSVPAAGQTTLKLISGDPVYYGNDNQVGADQNLGTIGLGASVVPYDDVWVRSQGLSSLSVTAPVPPPLDPSGLPPSVGQGVSYNGGQTYVSTQGPRDFFNPIDYRTAIDADDTNGLQGAATAAIAARGALIITRPLTTSGTVVLQNANGAAAGQFQLDIIVAISGTAPAITWNGGNNTSVIQAFNLINSTWIGLRIRVASPTSVVAFDLDTSTVNANLTGNTFIGCHFNTTGTPVTCTGWRIGHSSPSATNISNLLWISCKAAAGGAQTGWGWRIMGDNQFILDWHNCYTLNCAAGWTGVSDGTAPNGRTSWTFTGCGSTGNAVDFQPAGQGKLEIRGGRFETGQRFLDEVLGTTGGLDNSSLETTISTVISGYTPSDGILFKRTSSGTLNLEDAQVDSSGSAYGAAMVTLSCRSTAYGTMHVKGCNLYCTYPFFTISAGTWTRYELGNIQTDSSKRPIGNLPDSAPLLPGHIVRSGTYDGPMIAAFVTTPQPANGIPFALPFRLARQMTVSAIGINVATIGDVGSTIALCIWADAGGAPGPLLLAAGSVAGDGTAVYKEITGLSYVLPAGLYWLGGITQNVTTTAPKMYGTNAGSYEGINITSANGTTASTANSAGYNGASQGNSAPGAFTGVVTSGATPRVIVKAA